MVELNWKESQDLHRLQSAASRVTGRFSAPETASYHAPHGVAEFCHWFYHNGFEAELDAATAAFRETLAKGEELPEGVEIAPDGHPMMQPFYFERFFRQALEMAVLIGIDHGQRMHSYEPCKCIEGVGEQVEAQLKSGNWDHP